MPLDASTLSATAGSGRPEVPGRLSRVYYFYTRDNFPELEAPENKNKQSKPANLEFFKTNSYIAG